MNRDSGWRTLRAISATIFAERLSRFRPISEVRIESIVSVPTMVCSRRFDTLTGGTTLNNRTTLVVEQILWCGVIQRNRTLEKLRIVKRAIFRDLPDW